VEVKSEDEKQGGVEVKCRDGKGVEWSEEVKESNKKNKELRKKNACLPSLTFAY
jgi:hypothetical protein